MKEAVGKTVVEIAEKLPEEARATRTKTAKGARTAAKKGTGTGLESAGTGKKKTGTGRGGAKAGEKSAGGAKTAAKKTKGRAKARSGNEKLTPGALYRKMIAFGKIYQIEKEQDFLEAARIYSEEAGLIDQMRDRIAEDGLTVEKTYKTGSVEVAHPLLSELPRHVESANKCLATIGNMIGERGARVEKAARDLDAFRLHA